MANGKFHGKRKTGVKITNPLPLPVSVIIKSPTGALHTGDGKETWRTIKPGETLYIPTKGRAEVDIDVGIMRYDPVGNSSKIGDGSWEHVATKRALPQQIKRKEPEEPPLRSLGDMIEEMRKREEVKV